MNGKKVLQILAGILLFMGILTFVMLYKKGVSTYLSAGGAFLMGLALLLIARSLPVATAEEEKAEKEE